MNAISHHFSQNRRVRERKEKGLHPVNEVGRFSILVCCCFCSVCVSIIYAYDLFATAFQELYGLSGGDLSTISTVGMVFCYFTLPYSFLYELCGPFLLFILCCVSGGLGALLLGLTIQGMIPGNTVTLSVFYALVSMSSGLIDTAYITTLSEIFPRNRGPVACLAKVLTGLGGSIFAALRVSFFADSVPGFIYMLMALVIVVSIWASLTVVLPPYYINWWRRRNKSAEEIAELEATKRAYETKFVPVPRLAFGYVVLLTLLVFLAVESTVVAYVPGLSRGALIAIGVITVVLVLLLFVMLVPIKVLGGVNEPAPEVIEGETTSAAPDTELAELRPVQEASKMEAGVLASINAGGESASRQDPRYKGGIWVYLRGLDLWLIIFLFVTYGTLGILVMSNASTISVAISGHPRSEAESALYTSFLGLGSAIGRVTFGMFEAYVQHQDPANRKVLVTAILPLAPLVATISGVLLLLIPGKAILLPYLLVNFEEGIFAGVTALIFPCLFEQNHNVLYSVSFFVQCIATICYNRLMFGTIVDQKHDKLGLPRNVECNKRECVQTSLIVGTATAAVGTLIAVLIHVRYTRFVRRMRALEVEHQPEILLPDSAPIEPVGYLHAPLSSHEA